MKQVIALPTGKTIRVTWWQVALLAIALSGISRLIAARSSKKSQAFYAKKLTQAPWAPPGWLFGPAWTFNNFFLLWGLFQILGMERNGIRKQLLFLQLSIWIIFYSFDYVYFRKKSPILAALWTNADFVLALISFLKARKINAELANCYLPLTVWTFYAGTVADYQVLYNEDPVFNTKALL